MIAAFSVSRGGVQPFVGGSSDKHGKKRFPIVGLVIYALAGLSYSFANSVGLLIVIRTIHGSGSAVVVPIAMAYAGDLASATAFLTRRSDGAPGPQEEAAESA